ncbi:hypothetical protein CEQ90_13905 [Lewinellaceae bacterium SD302]|nr:hypothetical protein CEQ90_13905 [Lewinellaceae bacterium SD302]
MSLLHLAISFALVGLIWTIQLVHYPSFRYVPDFVTFHPHHTRSITMVVGPLMLAELALALWLAWESGWAWPQLVPLAMVLAIWALTFFWAIPLHERLAVTRDDSVIEQLIVANWPRTILWTVKGAWVLYFLTSK